MTTKRALFHRLAAPVAALAAVLVVAIATGSAFAQTQNDDGATQARERKEMRATEQEPRGDALRERIRERIESETGLQEQERTRLREHLGECKQLGLDDETVAALFDASEPLQKQIRTQERVLEMAREGLPHEPVMQKLQEGRRKGASDEARERACARMEEHVRAANRVMERARENGLAPGDADAERRRTREMAMTMWRGLKEEEGDELRERARLRLRDGSCTTEDLTASAETAMKLGEMGIERTRAMKLAGDALQAGYTAREMRQLSWMIMAAHAHGGPHDDVLATIERGIRNHAELGELSREMWQRGWMGPADEHGGHHGQNTMNDQTGGGPGGHPGGNTGGGGSGSGSGGEQGGGQSGTGGGQGGGTGGQQGGTGGGQ